MSIFSCKIALSFAKMGLFRLNIVSVSPVFVRSVVSKPVLKDVVFVLGAPGSGKGTLCERIVKDFNFKHLSAGDLLREEQDRPDSKYGTLIKETIAAGEIIPAHITCGLLEKAIKTFDNQRLLIDGFPRNRENLHEWSKNMSKKVHLHFVLFLDCPEEVCTERCIKRGLGSNRLDDNEETLKNRFHVFVNTTLPIIHHFEKNGILERVKSDRDPAEVSEDVAKVFESYNIRRQPAR